MAMTTAARACTRWSLLAVLAAASLSACRTGRPSAIDETLVRAPGAAAAQYDAGRAEIGALVGRVPSPELAAALETTARLHGHTWIGDLRLAALAAFCESQSAAGVPRPELVDFVMQHLGVYDPRAELILVDVPRDGARAALEGAVGLHLSDASFTHYGAALVSHGQSARLAVVLTERTVELSPVPRTGSVFVPISLRGRLLRDARNPRVVLTTDTAPRVVINAGSGPEFDVQVPAPKPGVYRIEIEADTERGPRTLAKLAVYEGVEAPLFWKRVDGPAAALDVEGARARLLEAINAERARAGLPALAAQPVLDQAAASHCVDMRDHAFFAHASPTTGSPADRVARAGLSPLLVLENIARGADAATVHASIVGEPGQRANLLHPNVTHVGIGVVEVQDAHGRSLLVTEIFAQVAAYVDTSQAAPTLLAAWNQVRTGRGATTLSLDPELTHVADEAAEQFVSIPGISEQSVIDAANAKLQRLSVAYRRVGAVLVLAHSIDEARTLEPPLDPAARSVGIGAAQGQRPDRGGPVLVIAFVLGWPR